MGRTAKIKSDLDDVNTMVEIFGILKDVAANHFFNTAKRKEEFARFADAFTEFFRMVNLSGTKSPLVKSEVDRAGIVVISSEGGFMADITAKICRTALAEGEKYKDREYIIIGYKGLEKMRILTDAKMTAFTGIEEKGLYKISLEVKDYIIEQVKERKIGRVFVAHPRAKSLEFIKPFVVQILPSDELLTKQQGLKDVIEKVIVESDPNDIMDYLADIWLTCRIFEMLEDCVIAGFAAQSQQLESSLERLKKDQKGLVIGFKKSKKSDIDKSLREVFTASKMARR